jgi:hypothetical protein
VERVAELNQGFQSILAEVGPDMAQFRPVPTWPHGPGSVRAIMKALGYANRANGPWQQLAPQHTHSVCLGSFQPEELYAARYLFPPEPPLRTEANHRRVRPPFTPHRLPCPPSPTALL